MLRGRAGLEGLPSEIFRVRNQGVMEVLPLVAVFRVFFVLFCRNGGSRHVE